MFAFIKNVSTYVISVPMPHTPRNPAVDHRCLSFLENGTNLRISSTIHNCAVAAEIRSHSGSEFTFPELPARTFVGTVQLISDKLYFAIPLE